MFIIIRVFLASLLLGGAAISFYLYGELAEERYGRIQAERAAQILADTRKEDAEVLDNAITKRDGSIRVHATHLVSLQKSLMEARGKWPSNALPPTIANRVFRTYERLSGYNQTLQEHTEGPYRPDPITNGHMVALLGSLSDKLEVCNADRSTVAYIEEERD